jgi:hypothetical protein
VRGPGPSAMRVPRPPDALRLTCSWHLAQRLLGGSVSRDKTPICQNRPRKSVPQGSTDNNVVSTLRTCSHAEPSRVTEGMRKRWMHLQYAKKTRTLAHCSCHWVQTAPYALSAWDDTPDSLIQSLQCTLLSFTCGKS